MPRINKAMRCAGAMVVALALGLTAGCGGGGGSGVGGEHDVGPPLAPLGVAAEPIKALAFAWNADALATGFELFEDLDGPGGPSPAQRVATLPAGSQSHVLRDVFLPDRRQAVYRLRACQGAACTDVAQGEPATLNPAIGYFKASNAAARDEFGAAVALSADGQTMAVAAQFEEGSAGGINGSTTRVPGLNAGEVYTYQRANGAWTETARLKAPFPRQGDRFGADIALSADGLRLIVAAPFDSGSGTGLTGDPAVVGLSESGAVYVFDRAPGGQWSQSAYIKSDTPMAGGRFGQFLALSGNGQWMALSSRSASGPQFHLRRLVNGRWEAASVLQGFGATMDSLDSIGYSAKRTALDHEGRTLLLADWRDDAGGEGVDPPTGGAPSADSGAAYVFARDAGDAWHPAAYLKPGVNRAGMHFGTSVAVSGDGNVLAVGAGWGNAASVNHGGEVFVYARGAVGWQAVEHLIRPATLVGAGRFGHAVALDATGDLLAVADINESSGLTGLGHEPATSELPFSGAVSLYRQTAPRAWTSAGLIKGRDAVSRIAFGWGLALSADGQALAVGARDESGDSQGIGGQAGNPSAQWSGAVYVY